MKQEANKNVQYYKLEKDKNIVEQLMMALYDLKIQSVLVEGGAMLLQSFIDAGVWDEARIINNEELTLRHAQGNNGLHAPVLNHGVKIFEQKILSDRIEIYQPK